MGNLYGTYVTITCKHDAGPDEKMQAVKIGIDMIIRKMQAWDIIPDFDTMEFIIHETVHSQKALDWYISEKGQQIDDEVEVITVGIKYNGKEREKMTI